MNAASQNLPHHLNILRQKLSHPTNYEEALFYFLDQFATDLNFIEQSCPHLAPHLEHAVRQAAAHVLDAAVKLEQCGILAVPDHGFYQGQAIGQGHILLFVYFEEADLGLVGIFSGLQNKPAHVVRFHSPAGLGGNPSRN